MDEVKESVDAEMILDFMAGHKLHAVLTGSQVYGTPTDASDIDLVVMMDEASATELKGLHDQESSYPERKGSLRFGRLNLIIVTDYRKFKAWRQGTAELIERKPVTREQAVELFKSLGV
jgi:predicted nucleotidyltransferase